MFCPTKGLMIDSVIPIRGFVNANNDDRVTTLCMYELANEEYVIPSSYKSSKCHPY